MSLKTSEAALMERRIVGSIISGGTIYVAGDEDAYAEHMRGHDMAPLIARGLLSGEWPDLGDAEPKKPAKKSTTKSE